MAKYKVVNTSEYDTVIDVRGKGILKDKKIIHPRANVELDINNVGLLLVKKMKHIKFQKVA